MGYYVAILRSPDIESASENPISREEWLACVRDDPKMRVLPTGPMPLPGMPNFRVRIEGDEVWWGGLPDVNPEGIVWFTYVRDGYIEVKNPDEDILHKMHEIACKLNPRVRGEEGEEYGEFGKMTKPPSDD